MTIFEKAIQLKDNAMKAREKERLDALKIVVSEFQRHPSKEPNDADAIAILKKLEADEIYMLAAKASATTSPFLEAIYSLLPKFASEIDIAEFMKTIDFSKLKNKMQAIGMVKSNFKGAVDSDMVKKMVEGWEV